MSEERPNDSAAGDLLARFRDGDVAAIHAGGSDRSESMTQPTSSGGMRSRTLLAALDEIATVRRRRYGRR